MGASGKGLASLGCTQATVDGSDESATNQPHSGPLPEGRSANRSGDSAHALAYRRCRSLGGLVGTVYLYCFGILYRCLGCVAR